MTQTNPSPTPQEARSQVPRYYAQDADPVRAAVRDLTKIQRKYVLAGYPHGDCTIRTIRVLDRKGIFHLVIDSPNGQFGFMRLTPFGKRVQAELKARADVRSEATITGNSGTNP